MDTKAALMPTAQSDPNLDQINHSHSGLQLAAKSQESSLEAQDSKDDVHQHTSVTKSKQARFSKLFDGVKDDVLLNFFKCAYLSDHHFLYQGNLFITSTCLAFYSPVFDTAKHVIPLDDIINIKKDLTYFVPNAIVVQTKKRKFHFGSLFFRDSAYNQIQRIWRKALQRRLHLGTEECDPDADVDVDGCAPVPARFISDDSAVNTTFADSYTMRHVEAVQGDTPEKRCDVVITCPVCTSAVNLLATPGNLLPLKRMRTHSCGTRRPRAESGCASTPLRKDPPLLPPVHREYHASTRHRKSSDSHSAVNTGEASGKTGTALVTTGDDSLVLGRSSAMVVFVCLFLVGLTLLLLMVNVVLVEMTHWRLLSVASSTPGSLLRNDLSIDECCSVNLEKTEAFLSRIEDLLAQSSCRSFQS